MTCGVFWPRGGINQICDIVQSFCAFNPTTRPVSEWLHELAAAGLFAQKFTPISETFQRTPASNRQRSGQQHIRAARNRDKNEARYIFLALHRMQFGRNKVSYRRCTALPIRNGSVDYAALDTRCAIKHYRRSIARRSNHFGRSAKNAFSSTHNQFCEADFASSSDID